MISTSANSLVRSAAPALQPLAMPLKERHLECLMPQKKFVGSGCCLPSPSSEKSEMTRSSNDHSHSKKPKVSFAKSKAPTLKRRLRLTDASTTEAALLLVAFSQGRKRICTQ